MPPSASTEVSRAIRDRFSSTGTTQYWVRPGLRRHVEVCQPTKHTVRAAMRLVAGNAAPFSADALRVSRTCTSTPAELFCAYVELVTQGREPQIQRPHFTVRNGRIRANLRGAVNKASVAILRS